MMSELSLFFSCEILLQWGSNFSYIWWQYLITRDGEITAILDQKNYVEELNRHLR